MQDKSINKEWLSHLGKKERGKQLGKEWIGKFSLYSPDKEEIFACFLTLTNPEIMKKPNNGVLESLIDFTKTHRDSTIDYLCRTNQEIHKEASI